MEIDGGRTREGMFLLLRVVGFGCAAGNIERRLGAGADVVAPGGVEFLVGIAAESLAGGLCGILSSWARLMGFLRVSPSVETCAVSVEILGNGVSGSEESGLDWLLLECICLLFCQEPEATVPEGLIFSGIVKGCDVLRLTAFGEELRADALKLGAELMRCICGMGCIMEPRFPVDNFVVQCAGGGSSATNDCGLSPLSVIAGGGRTFESCSGLGSVSSGMLSLELRTLPRGAICGSAVIVEAFQPITGESSPRSPSFGGDILVLIVRSIPAPEGTCEDSIADRRLVELEP